MAQGRYYCGYGVKIGIVCDAILLDSISAAADFTYLSPTQDGLDATAAIDLLMVVSAWRGLNDGEWIGVAKEDTPQRTMLYRMIDACHARGIPVAFYSKEDPPNYDVFLEIARRCDRIFTSAVECVPRYVSDCGHDRVHVLEFCFDPAANNPTGNSMDDIVRGVLFSGSWMRKYPARCRDLRILLDGAVESGEELEIIDRNSGREGTSRYKYPEKYSAFLHPAVEHAQLAARHKARAWTVNVNSVTESETMFAGRCYELLASGCAVVSNYSLGMCRSLPEVAIAHTKGEARAIVGEKAGRALYDRKMAGIRAVMRTSTCYDRIGEFLRAMGLDAPAQKRTVLVLAEELTDGVRRMFEAQTYPDKSLCSIKDVSEQEYARYDIVAIFGKDCTCGPFYIEDMANVFKYADVDFATEFGNVFGHTDLCGDLKKTVFWRESVDLCRIREGRVPSGLKGYSVPVPPDAEPVLAQEPPVAVVEIEVGDKGRYLQSIAFFSLQRSRFFPRLRIVLVDVDKTDVLTAAVVDQICGTYGNVKVGDVHAETKCPRIRMKAADSIVARGFDNAVKRYMSGMFASVSGDVLLCGRKRRLLCKGVVIKGNSWGMCCHVRDIVLARHFEMDESVGTEWHETPVVKPSVFVRAWVCYCENGFWYTVRRIFFGRQY